MKYLSCIILSLFISYSSGMANEADLSRRKLPALSIKAAIDKADAFIKREQEAEGRFLARVEYHESGPWTETNPKGRTAGPYWLMTYEREVRTDGGQVFILVYMDGTTRRIGGL